MNLFDLFPKSKNSDLGTKYEVLEYSQPQRVSTKYKLLCTSCKTEVEAQPIKIFCGQNPCKCGSRFYTTFERKKERLLQLVDSSKVSLLSLLDESLKWNSILDVKCKECAHEFKVPHTAFVTNSVGCQMCSKNRPYSDQEYKERLQEALLSSEKIVEYEILKDSDFRSLTRIKLRCECGSSSEKSISDFLNNPSACRDCASSGYSRTKTGYLYILSIKNSGILVGYKFGITNSSDKRLANISNKTKLELKPLCLFKFDSGFEASDIEFSLKNKFGNYLNKNDLPDGYTETFSPSELPSVMETIYNRLVYSNL